MLVGRADSSFDFRVRLKGKRRGELNLNGGSPIYDDVVFPRGRGYGSAGYGAGQDTHDSPRAVATDDPSCDPTDHGSGTHLGRVARRIATPLLACR